MAANAAVAEQPERQDEQQDQHHDDPTFSNSSDDSPSDTDSYASSSLSTQSAPATLLESRDILRHHLSPNFDLKPLGQPYSLPEPHKWQDVAKWKWQNMLRRQSLSTLQPATWYADRAARPLLLTFDAFDTLFTPVEPIAKQYRDVALEFGLDFAEDDIMKSFKKEFKAMNTAYPNYGKETSMTPEEWWTQLIAATLTPLLPSSSSPTQSDSQPTNTVTTENGTTDTTDTDPTNIDKANTTTLPPDLPAKLYTHFSTSTGYTLFPDVLPFLALLGASSYSAGIWPPRRTMLGILSNSDPRVRSILQSFNIPITPSLYPPRYTPHSRYSRRHADFGPAGFAFATLSYEAGFAKPDRMIFDRAVRDAQGVLAGLHPVARLSRTGGEVLRDVHGTFHHMHVGDDLEKDVLPAMELGWDAILLDRECDVETEVREIEGKQVTVVNSLLALRRVVTKERLDAGAMKGVPWVDLEGKGPVLVSESGRRRRERGEKLAGRRVERHPLSGPGVGWRTLV